MNNIYELSQKTKEAHEHLGGSVKIINKDAVIHAWESDLSSNYFIGVKDNNNIGRDLIKKLCEDKEFIWHTIDSSSDRGRAVDITLNNPINGRLMTGSSSGSAINVLYGINDLGIGTDGGGSVIYPAMALNLYSFMGKGMGLMGKNTKISTDGIKFTPGIGFISYDLSLILKAVKKLEIYKEAKDKIKISLGSMAELESETLKKKIGSILIEKGFKKIDEEFSDDRNELIGSLKKIFKETDILIIYEKAIDTNEYGDSIMGSLGIEARAKQNRSNKKLGKVANILNLTTISIPDKRSSSGILILAKTGVEYGTEALKIAEKLMGEYMPKLHYDYFKRSYLMKKNEIIFEL